MKLLVALTVLMLLFIVFGVYMQQQILKTASEMREKISDISREINDENWKAAKDSVKSLHKWWNDIQDTWDIFIVHHEIETVEILLARLLSYIKSEEKPSALAELAALDMQFSHIYRNEMFNLQNVL